MSPFGGLASFAGRGESFKGGDVEKDETLAKEEEDDDEAEAAAAAAKGDEGGGEEEGDEELLKANFPIRPKARRACPAFCHLRRATNFLCLTVDSFLTLCF